MIGRFVKFVAKAVGVIFACLFGMFVIGIMVGGDGKSGQQVVAEAKPEATKDERKPKAKPEAAKKAAAKPVAVPEDMSASRVTWKQAETMCRRAATASARYGFDPDLWSITSSTSGSRTYVIVPGQLTNAFGTEFQTAARCEVNLTTGSLVSISFDR